jgi:hypothetical protein
VSVPFLEVKREALVDSFLCYLERDIREFRSVTSDTVDTSLQIAPVVSNAHAIKLTQRHCIFQPKLQNPFIQGVLQQIAKNWKLKFENSATVTSLCNNEAANPISHRSLIRFHSPTLLKFNTNPASNGYFQLELLLAQNQ